MATTSLLCISVSSQRFFGEHVPKAWQLVSGSSTAAIMRGSVRAWLIAPDSVFIFKLELSVFKSLIVLALAMPCIARATRTTNKGKAIQLQIFPFMVSSILQSETVS